jgi:hypothetical protein
LLVVDLRPDSVVALYDGVSLHKWAKEVDKFVDLCEREVQSKSQDFVPQLFPGGSEALLRSTHDCPDDTAKASRDNSAGV